MYQRHFPHTKDRFSNGSITIHQHDAFRPAAHRQHDPWWEIEARERITSGDIQSLDAVFRYHLYGPTDALLATLRKCTKERLNDIFNRLSHAETCCEPMQSVEGIANLVEPYYESPSPTPKGWEPREMRGLDAEGIANTINNRSVELLSHIEFQDYLRYAFGYTQDSVDQAIIQHRIITWTTWCYLGEYPEMMTTYKEVKQVTCQNVTLQSISC